MPMDGCNFIYYSPSGGLPDYLQVLYVLVCIKGKERKFLFQFLGELATISTRFMLLFSIDQPVLQLKRSGCYSINLVLVLSAVLLKREKLLCHV